MRTTTRQIKRPVVILNCKTYERATGSDAVRLAVLLERAAKRYGIDARIAVQATDIERVVRKVSIPVYAQHVDPVSAGKTTGWLTTHAIRSAGAKGVLLNHSEHPLDTATIRATLAACRHEGLTTVVCATTDAALRRLAALGADCYAIEPPALIGGKVSVTTASPGIIPRAVASTKRPLLVGAGVGGRADLDTALRYGAKGVLLASHIADAKDPALAIRKLLAPVAR